MQLLRGFKKPGPANSSHRGAKDEVAICFCFVFPFGDRGEGNSKDLQDHEENDKPSGATYHKDSGILAHKRRHCTCKRACMVVLVC